METLKIIGEFLGSVAAGSLAAALGGVLLVTTRICLSRRRRHQLKELNDACRERELSYKDAALILLSDEAAEKGLSEKAKEVRSRL